MRLRMVASHGGISAAPAPAPAASILAAPQHRSAPPAEHQALLARPFAKARPSRRAPCTPCGFATVE